MTKFTAIAAMSENRVIGTADTLPWDIPEEMKFFRTTTLDHPIIVGRKTFESKSWGGKPLPRRPHVVVTRQEGYTVKGAKVVTSLEDAVAHCREAFPDQEVFVCGGGEIYKQSLSFLDEILLTVIHREYPGDTKFPEFSPQDFELVSERDEGEDPSYTYTRWRRVSKA